MFLVALYLPWCRYLSAQVGGELRLYADNLKCVSGDPHLLLIAARFTTGYVQETVDIPQLQFIDKLKVARRDVHFVGDSGPGRKRIRLNRKKSSTPCGFECACSSTSVEGVAFFWVHWCFWCWLQEEAMQWTRWWWQSCSSQDWCGLISGVAQARLQVCMVEIRFWLACARDAECTYARIQRCPKQQLLLQLQLQLQLQLLLLLLLQQLLLQELLLQQQLQQLLQLQQPQQQQQQQQYNLGSLRFNRRGTPTPLWGVEACSHPSRRPNPIPAFPPYVVRTPHLHGAPTTEETVKLWY